MKLRPYQEDAADFLFEHDRAMVLAPMGAGKTAITLTAMDDMLRDGVVKRWLVLAPKRVAQHVWRQEAAKWAPGLTVSVAVGNYPQRIAAFNQGADIVVTNYDAVGTLTTHELRQFDGIVFDELTRLKNASGVRFKALDRLTAHINIRWGLTGSFTSNGLEDVFGQCKIIDQKLLGKSKTKFLNEYFYCIDRDTSQWEPATGSLDKVMARVRPATYVLEPGEYADKLPPLNTVEMPCDLHQRGPYEELKATMTTLYEAHEIVATNAAALTSKLQQSACGFAYSDTGTAVFSHHKINLLSAILEGNQRAPTIVVYNFKAELELLTTSLPKAETLDAPDAIERWNKGEIEVLLIHPQSAGHGLNLQAGGHHIVWMSLPWSLELYEQTVGRLHRGGQTQPVWNYVLLTTNTIEARMWAALRDKRTISDLAIEELKTCRSEA